MRPLNIFVSAALAISLSLSLSGCSEDSGTNPIDTGPQPGGSNSAAIGPLGGNVAYGDVLLIFPAGAVQTVQIVQLGIPQTAPNYPIPDTLAQMGYIYEASPADLQLNSLIPIAFVYDDAALDSLAETTLLLWSLEGDSSTLTPLQDIYIDAAQNVITGSTEQLGFFVLTVSIWALINLPPAAPELIAPYSGMPGNRLSMVLRWENAPGADNYQIQVSENSDFTSLHYYGQGLGGNSAGILGFSQNSTYYWRVRGSNEHGLGQWSNVWTFATGDGSNPQTVAGTWELLVGEYQDIMMEPTFEIVMTGNLMISFDLDSFDAEGERWIYWQQYIGGSLLDDTSYVTLIDEQGFYATTDSSISLPSAIFEDPNIYYQTEEKPYSINEDTLTIRFYDDPYYSQAVTFLRI